MVGHSALLTNRDRTKVALACAIECVIAGVDLRAGHTYDSPWDAWWVRYRSRLSAARSRPDLWPGECADCVEEAGSLVCASPPGHPDDNGPGERTCACLTEWARSMRSPAPAIAWPPWRLTLGMAKPGADTAAVAAELTRTHTVLDTFTLQLTPADVRRLYPDAYGAAFVARTDDYLTSGPVTVFALLMHDSAIGHAKEIKLEIRRRLGGDDKLRNHLHMPDSPGDAFADLDHLAGRRVFHRFYERYERDRATARLARYRALLERPDSRHRAG